MFFTFSSLWSRLQPATEAQNSTEKKSDLCRHALQFWDVRKRWVASCLYFIGFSGFFKSHLCTLKRACVCMYSIHYTATICWWSIQCGMKNADLLMTLFICLVLTYLWFKENWLLEKKWEYCTMYCVIFCVKILITKDSSLQMLQLFENFTWSMLCVPW